MLPNRKIFVASCNESKTQWLVDKLIEQVKLNPNNNFIYVGNEASYDQVATKYSSITGKRCPLKPINRSHGILGYKWYNTACFTNNFFDSYEALEYSKDIEKREILWYITMNAEDFVADNNGDNNDA